MRNYNFVNNAKKKCDFLLDFSTYPANKPSGAELAPVVIFALLKFAV